MEDRIEEVKSYIKQYRTEYMAMRDMGLRIKTEQESNARLFDKYAKQICQLFEPKPDGSRLLKDEEVVAWMVENGKSGFMGDYAREAQRDLTASIVRAEERERITNIIKEYKLESVSARDDSLERRAIGWKLLWQCLMPDEVTRKIK